MTLRLGLFALHAGWTRNCNGCRNAFDGLDAALQFVMLLGLRTIIPNHSNDRVEVFCPAEIKARIGRNFFDDTAKCCLSRMTKELDLDQRPQRRNSKVRPRPCLSDR